jgi:hypothetical protein
LISGTGATIDPNTGLSVTPYTDLYQFLHTSPEKPKKSATTTDGVIENLTASATRELDELQAHTVRRCGDGEMRLSFGNRVVDMNIDKVVMGWTLPPAA